MSNNSGFSLVELLVAISIIGLAMAGTLLAFDTAVRSSADPQTRQQARAIAQSLLAEVLQQPVTYCDPQDPAVDTATSAADCTVSQAPLSPQPASETRLSLTDPFDNVADYNGYSSASETPPGIYTLADPTTPVAGLGDYTASVVVQEAGAAFGVASSEVLRVTVTVQKGADGLALDGYRFRYAPNAGGGT